ncbi:MAG TPA: MFS transporter [Ferrovibrio sp.]|jgi:MFS family permease|uniref:MFS transporter n=1 Tax=Ferrovibrio sp. TaxID=1917215 RepID=UPI002B4B7F1C|nr:MFS transporter [Ferrovibrio sp.]HLT77082.1 MFS transporter [Ferrovibrio sp.]
MSEIESRYAWARLVAAIALGTIGGVGMWSIVVALPAVQAEFGVARADASMPYALAMIGFVFGTVLMGRLADRFGIIVPVIGATLALAAGYASTAFAGSILSFALLYGLLIGLLGGSAFFAPLLADTSMWFDRRRGLAMGLCASGNYVSGTIWPPVLEHFIAEIGWRETHLWIAAFCLLTMLPLSLMLRRPPPKQAAPVPTAANPQPSSGRPLGLPPNVLQALLVVAGLGCCVAMSMPQVHIVAYCVDLGYGPARGAEMLALMLGFGIVSRLASGWILDRIGGLATLLLGAVLQGAALAFYIPFDGLASLYIISAMFGLVQGGIVPSYAFIIREHFPAAQAGFRVSLAISATLAGMALGGWLSGAIYDLTGSYKAALVNGVAWNLMNVTIVSWLLLRQWRQPSPAAA